MAAGRGQGRQACSQGKALNSTHIVRTPGLRRSRILGSPKGIRLFETSFISFLNFVTGERCRSVLATRGAQQVSPRIGPASASWVSGLGIVHHGGVAGARQPGRVLGTAGQAGASGESEGPPGPAPARAICLKRHLGTQALGPSARALPVGSIGRGPDFRRSSAPGTWSLSQGASTSMTGRARVMATDTGQVTGRTGLCVWGRPASALGFNSYSALASNRRFCWD